MKTAPFALNENTWRLLFEMGDILLSQMSIRAQHSIILQELKHITGAEIELVLLERFKPLPTQKNDKNVGSTDDIRYVNPSELQAAQAVANNGGITIETQLQKRQSIFGKIFLSFPEPLELSDDYYDFLNIAGRYIAGILDMTRVSALKDLRQDQLALVRSASFEIARCRNTSELFAKIVQLVHDSFHFYLVAVYTLSSDQQRLKLRANAGQDLSKEEMDDLNMGDGIPIGQGLVGICAQTGSEVLSPDIQKDKHYRQVQGLSQTRSEICLPLMVNDQPIGVLEILSERLDAFHENDVLVLRILADSIALALENAELFDDLLEKTWISTVMLQVAEAAQAYDNIQDLLEAQVRILPLLVGVEKCAIYRLGRYAEDFFLNAHHGFSKEIEPKLAMLPYSQAAAERFHEVVVLKIPMDLDRGLVTGDPSVEDQNGTKCCKLVPMVAHDKVFGVLLVDEVLRSNLSYRDSQLKQQDVLMAVARQIALAIENFDLKELQEYETYITTVLLQIAEMVAAAENLDETLSNVIALLPLVVGVDTALIYILDEQGTRLTLRSKYSQSWKKEMGSMSQSINLAANKSLNEILSLQQMVVCQIESQPPGEWLQIDYRHYMKSSEIPRTTEKALMVFPLFIGGEQYGLLMVYEYSGSIEVREKKMEIIKGIAQQLSIAIQNERLKREMVDRERLRREFQLAQDIQRTFLPEKMPTIEGWNVDVRWRPALQVGGDFYDAIPIGEDHYGLLIADVSDKGLPASLYMTVARTLIHAAAREGNSPVATLQNVNQLLLENSREGLFITVFYAVLNIRSGELIYANAGHNKPLLLRKNHKEVLWLEKGGMPLGVEKDLPIQNIILQIRPGDHLVMYTDGVTDARSPDDNLFGEDRLFHVVSNYNANTEGSLIEAIDSKLLDFQSNASASDDVTLLVIHRGTSY